MANEGNKTQLIKCLFAQWQKSSYAKRYTVVNFAKSKQCYHLTSTDAETAKVHKWSVNALAA